MPIVNDSEDVQRLIDNMIETMHNASGVGLAAPQVGRSERLFVIDVSAVFEDEEASPESETELVPEPTPRHRLGPIAFINPELVLLESDDVDFEEGCLSIPDLREDVTRPDAILIKYLDRHFQPREIETDGLIARVIQHEFDHLNGVLFVDHLSPLKRRLLRRRLREMAKGDVSAEYPIRSLT